MLDSPPPQSGHGDNHRTRTLAADAVQVLPVAMRCTLGESPWWDGETLSWVDIVGRVLHTASLDGAHTRSLPVPDRPGFAVRRRGGGWVLGLPDGLWTGDDELGGLTHSWRAPHDTTTHRLNDGKTDAAGRLWFGSMTDAEVDPVAALYRADAREVVQVADGVTTSNGLGWSPDGRTFYYTDSGPRTIWAYDVDPDSGQLHDRRVFATDTDCFPDGLTVDVDGCVWSAKWDGGRVVRYTPDGLVDLVVDLPVRRPTSCMFVGPDRSTLAVTSASLDQPESDDLAGAVFLIRTGTAGPLLVPAAPI